MVFGQNFDENEKCNIGLIMQFLSVIKALNEDGQAKKKKK